jgi:hypothetical protein
MGPSVLIWAAVCNPLPNNHMIFPLHERHILLTVTQFRFHNEATGTLAQCIPN